MKVKEEFMVSPMGGTCDLRRALILKPYVAAMNRSAINPLLSCSADALEQTGMEGQEDEVHESRSESDKMDDASGDDLEASDKPPAMQKPYHRHTPHHIQQLEAVFKECPHPDVNQRKELSRRVCLKTRQVKFWFQNRQSQMKMQMQRQKNSILQQENNKPSHLLKNRKMKQIKLAMLNLKRMGHRQKKPLS